MAFWERAAHSVNCMFSFVFFVVSHVGFEGGTALLTAQVPGHCLPFTFVSRFRIDCYYK